MKIEILKTKNQLFNKMTGRWSGLGAVLVLFIFIGVAGIWYAWPQDTHPKGERLYAVHCAQCHGGDGQGDTGMALDSTGHMYQHTCAQLKLHISIGSRGSGYMPSYRGKLSDQEMADIVRSFQRWWTDEQIAEFQARTNCLESDLVPSIMQQLDLP
jgi:cytochrome c553